MAETVRSVETLVVSIPRDVPYLGALGPGETVNPKGYFVRRSNRTVYPTTDRTVLVKVTTEGGVVGWGETYGLAAPGAIVELIEDLLGPFVVGRDPRDAIAIHEDLYDLMRVRGHFGGYYLDAIAGIDIALWDASAKLYGVPLGKLLGGQRATRIPAYVSGLPKPTLAERARYAADWKAKGFRAVKFAGAMAGAGEVEEMRTLRDALGPEADIMVDLHWRYTAHEAIKLIAALDRYDLYFAEAPCQPEDQEGQAQVAARAGVPVALGEELRTAYEYRPRLVNRCMSIVQPEMGHTGVTEFVRISRLAEAFHCKVIPHATIGVGIFLAASLQAASALPNVPYHEYQPSIFDRNARFLVGSMRCESGFYQVPDGPGLGVEPSDGLFVHVVSRSA